MHLHRPQQQRTALTQALQISTALQLCLNKHCLQLWCLTAAQTSSTYQKHPGRQWSHLLLPHPP